MKKTMKRYIFILLISMISFGVNANNKIESKIDSLVNSYNYKRADKAFENMAYIKAIDIYVNLINKEFYQSEIYGKLAFSYLKTGDWENSVKYYNNLFSTSDYSAEDLYNFAQALKSIGNYAESDLRMKQYAALNETDSRIKRQENTSNRIKEIKSIIRYNISPVSFNSEFSDFGATLLDNKLYFVSERRVDAVVNYEYAWKEAPYLDIYELKMDGNVSKPEFLKDKVNSKYHDGPACFSTDGKEMFFTRNNALFRFISKKGDDNTNNLRIYRAQNINGSLSQPEELPFNNDNYSCGHPSISYDGSILYFTSDMPGGYGGSDIYFSERNGETWTEPKNLGPEINTEGNEMFPFIHELGNLYFASDGHFGMGGLDLFIAKLENGKYTIENMGYPLNSKDDDFSLIINKEQKEGYFASNREGGKGDDDIYEFQVLKVNLNLQGKVFDEETKNRIANVSVLLENEEGEKVRLLSSSEDYDYKTEVQPNKTYKIKVNNEEYNSFNTNIVPSTLAKENNTVEYDIYLKKTPVWGVFGKVYYKETMEYISDVNIHVTNKNTEKVMDYLSEDEGLFRIKLEKESEYNFFFEKEGIFSIRADYSTIGRPAGWVNADEFIELAFEKVELNKKIEIPNIYYDVAKWNIREDAAVELDNVVQFLIDNPSIKIELGSHTDARGSASSNQILSQKRAQSAVDYIVSKGIDTNRITAKGYGEEQIKNRCVDGVQCSKAEHQENRRTEIRITGI
jgi:outer membrane protein OmpA-like peptidoglycan-associated protein